MKRYCISCGSPTEYSVKKPIFCSTCGSPFDKSQATKVVTKPIVEKRVIIQRKYVDDKPVDNAIVANHKVEIEDETDDASVPDISQIEMDIESDSNGKNRGVKLGEVMGTAIPPEGEKRVRQKIKGKKSSKKQTLEDFAKEAGTIKKTKDSQ
jgi:hypothetical protein